MFKIMKYVERSNMLCKGDTEQTQTGTSTSTYDPTQSDFYGDLLDRSQSWLDNGGVTANADYSSQMADTLGQQAGVYQDMISGGYDETALNNAMNANAQSATQSFERNVIPTLTSQANLAGQAGSSRSGIAQGLAASDLNQQISNTNSSMIWNAEQSAADRQAQGAAGLTNLFTGYNALSQYENQQDNTDLESLLTYQGLISGNYGGTETSSNTGTSSAASAGGFI